REKWRMTNLTTFSLNNFSTSAGVVMQDLLGLKARAERAKSLRRKSRAQVQKREICHTTDRCKPPLQCNFSTKRSRTVYDLHRDGTKIRRFASIRCVRERVVRKRHCNAEWSRPAVTDRTNTADSRP